MPPRTPRPLATRRAALRTLAAAAAWGLTRRSRSEGAAGLRLATFAADVTPPLGHPLMGGGVAPAARIGDPLEARGVVLLGAGRPVVLIAVDWCEIRNDAHARWRGALAVAAGTIPARVLVASVHQHDAPLADLDAQRRLDAVGLPRGQGICDPAFHERAVAGAAKALAASLASARPVTHVGVGKAKVDRVASNRRYLGPDGRPAFGRTSATRDPAVRDQPEGTIDPWLRTLAFFDGDAPLAALNVYATHPMSHYGDGVVSADFVGMARRARQAALPEVFQVYLSGCSGDVTAGKYNDGAPENRPALAGRLERAMADAWEALERHPVDAGSVAFRSVPLRLEPRDGAGFTIAHLEARLRDDPRPFGRCLAALGLSWRARADAGATLDLPALDVGPATLVLLPGESYVEFQRLAQRLRPDRSVIAVGYGECATGYVPTERAVAEGDTNLRDWCWVAPGSEARLAEALAKALEAGGAR